MTKSHFAQRCIDRGVTDDPTNLERDLYTAIREARNTDIAHPLVEYVLTTNSGKSVWRFIAPSGIPFYAVWDDTQSRLITVITQDMLPVYKDARKGKCRGVRHAAELKVAADIRGAHFAAKKRRHGMA